MGGLFPQFSSSAADVSVTVVDQGGVRRMAAVQMAINRVNDKHDGIYDTLLPQIKVRCKSILWCTVCCNFDLNVGIVCFMKLELLIGDSKRQERSAMTEAYRHHNSHSVALIGPASSGPTQAVSRWLSLPAIKPQRALIGYSATSSELSTSEFSNFLRTSPSDDIQAQAMLQLMQGLSTDEL